jgi:hypothetical protein
MPMMTTTSMISVSVKPRRFVFLTAFFLISIFIIRFLFDVWLMVSTGSNMPMKMVPMKPAMKNSSSGSAKATAVFRLRSKSPSVTTAMRTSSASSLPLSSATEIISRTEPENRIRQSARLWPSRPPCCTRSMAWPPRPRGSGCRSNAGRRSGFGPAARPRRSACPASGKTAPWRIGR